MRDETSHKYNLSVGIPWVVRSSPQTWKWTGMIEICFIFTCQLMLAFFYPQPHPGHTRLSACSRVCSQSGYSGNVLCVCVCVSTALIIFLRPYRKSSVLPVGSQDVSWVHCYRFPVHNRMLLLIGLKELQMAGNCFPLLLNAVLLHKCLQSRYSISFTGSVWIAKMCPKVSSLFCVAGAMYSVLIN